MYFWELLKDVYHEASECASTIHLEEKDGQVLIFLPGADEINNFITKICSQIEVLSRSLNTGRVGKFLVLPLHSKMSQADQDKALAVPGFDF